MQPRNIINFYVVLNLMTLCSCNKLIEIRNPQNSVVTGAAFSDDESAEATVRGLYGVITNSNNKPMNFLITATASMSSDDLISTVASGAVFNTNSLVSSNSNIFAIWSNLYGYIYQTNACIEGLTTTTTLSNEVKSRLSGEVKFLRALFYFYLVNIYGDVPLVLSLDWRVTSLLPRALKNDIYHQIVNDLVDAKELLPAAYVSGEKVRANKWAAVAMLARVHLYLGNWQSAETEASNVINNGGYQIISDLNSVFLKNSDEAILQLQPAGFISPGFNATIEGTQFIPRNSSIVPTYIFTDQLKLAFEGGDFRYSNWSSTITRSGVTYRYPFKYKVRGVSGNTSVTEYYMLLRFAELYLIRAEARANLNNLTDAITDLNVIRIRANLEPLLNTLDQAQVLASVIQERRTEFFAEWGHRWFDLKRSGKADTILGPIKGTNWQSTDQLYPIPLSEMQRNPNLVQNPGYQ